jgi:hypothetical protein
MGFDFSQLIGMQMTLFLSAHAEEPIVEREVKLLGVEQNGLWIQIEGRSTESPNPDVTEWMNLMLSGHSKFFVPFSKIELAKCG